MSSRARKWIKLAIQLLVSAGLVAFLARQLDFTQIKTILDRPGGWPWRVGAFVLLNASKIVAALRLNIYQRHVGVVLSEGQNLRLYSAGMFLNLFLPGGIGGDGYKIFVLNRQQGVPVKKLVLVTLADRVSGLLCLLLLLCGLAPWVGVALGWKELWISAGAALTAFSIATFIYAAHRKVLAYSAQRTGSILALGLAVQLLQVACIFVILIYLQVAIENFQQYIFVFLISSIAAVLPITVGGLGAREITFFYCLSFLKLNPMDGVLSSSIFFLLSAASSTIGALFIKRSFLLRPSQH